MVFFEKRGGVSCALAFNLSCDPLAEGFRTEGYTDGVVMCRISACSMNATFYRVEPMDLDSQTSEELFRLASVMGNRDAFRTLFSRHGPQLKRFFMRSGLRSQQADEMVQEVMLKIWRRARSYDPERASFQTWLFTIARNQRIDQVRKKRVPEVELDDQTNAVVLAPSAFDALDSAQRKSQVRQAIQHLPEKQAAVLNSAYIEGKTLVSIANESKLPLGTIKSRLRLALERLRSTLVLEGN